MTAIARAKLRISKAEIDIETLKTIGMFCMVGLTVTCMVLSYGVDLSPGFF